jgi:hypothetical protein
MNRKQINSTEDLLAAGHADGGDNGHEFHVTFYNSHHGRVSIEVFDDAASAERFASRMTCDEDDWATVDAVPLQQRRIAA